MTFYDDPPDGPSAHEKWRTDSIMASEPYASLFKLRRPVGRYDLISNMAKRLGFPPGDLRPTTEQLLWDL